MTITSIADVTNQAQKFWAPQFTKQLRESLLLGSLVNKDYDGVIANQGDTVYVSQIYAPEGQLLTVGTDADTFATEKVETARVAIQANKRAVAAYEVQDLAKLQSQLDAQDSELRDSLLYAMNKQINDYLYSLVVPSSSPDHTITSVATLAASNLKAVRVLAGQAKWMRNKPWYGLLDPSYYGDVCFDSTLASGDFNGGDASIVAGQVAKPRGGFQLLEDNSRDATRALFFHPDFMHLVMQTQVQIKISDLHAQKKFGFVMSCDIVFGAGLGIDGDEKCITVTG